VPKAVDELESFIEKSYDYCKPSFGIIHYLDIFSTWFQVDGTRGGSAESFELNLHLYQQVMLTLWDWLRKLSVYPGPSLPSRPGNDGKPMDLGISLAGLQDSL